MIAIYEPLYLPGQSLTEPSFRPFRLENNAYADWREFRIIVDMYERGLHREQRYTGLFSPKFGLKTGITGTQFLNFVRDNADADVCFINPFAYLPYISFNAWMQGEASHPGIVVRAQALFDAAGVKFSIADVPRHGPNLLCYCNFWVGTETFWENYVGGVLQPLAHFLQENPGIPASRAVLEPTKHLDPAPFLPFIVERLFSTYLSLETSVDARAYPLDALQSCLNDFERDVVTSTRREVDSADSESSFPVPLKQNMALLCKLWQTFNQIYYAHHPHPHQS